MSLCYLLIDDTSHKGYLLECASQQQFRSVVDDYGKVEKVARQDGKAVPDVASYMRGIGIRVNVPFQSSVREHSNALAVVDDAEMKVVLVDSTRDQVVPALKAFCTEEKAATLSAKAMPDLASFLRSKGLSIVIPESLIVEDFCPDEDVKQ